MRELTDPRADFAESCIRVFVFYVGFTLAGLLLVLEPYGNYREELGAKKENAAMTQWYFQYHGNCIRKGGR